MGREVAIMKIFSSQNVWPLVAAGGLVLVLAVVLAVVLAGWLPLGRPNETRVAAPAVTTPRAVDGEFPRRITNRIGMEFVEIPPGRFVMGSLRGNEDEQPHVVHITRPFFLGVTEYTGWNPSEAIASMKSSAASNRARQRKRECPAFIDSWQDASRIAASISAVDPEYDYRLPTEAEWEYACRAQVNMLKPSEDHKIVTQEPGGFWQIKQKPPNAFGLYDMLRNVGEFCSDWYSPDYYQNSPLEDPKGPPTGTGIVVRGVRSEGTDRSYSAWRRYPAPPEGDSNILIGVRFVLEKEE
jgi:formylglycine-generating enzyme required for sulfatase activity